MYLEKLKFFHTQYPEDKCINGITTAQFNDVAVGTPGIIRVDPFNPFDPNGRPSSNGLRFQAQPSINSYGKITSAPKPKPNKEPKERTTGLDMRKMAAENIQKANRIVSSSISKASLFLPFSTYNNTVDYQTCAINARNFHINGRTPLIYDECRHIKIQRLSDTHHASEISSFPDVLSEALKEYRYVNYTFTDIAKSNTKYILEDLNTIYNALIKSHQHRVSIFQFPHDRLNNILDVLSISFYQMADVIPIFDSRRSEGICMELFMTNSRTTGDNLMYEHNTATFRFMFAKSRENLYSIDGEAIKRGCDMSAADALSRAAHMISQEVPNDKDTKKLSKSKRVMKEEA